MDDSKNLFDVKFSLGEIYGMLDSDELYDALPGDGQDDYIIGQLKKFFEGRARAKAQS